MSRPTEISAFVEKEENAEWVEHWRIISFDDLPPLDLPDYILWGATKAVTGNKSLLFKLTSSDPMEFIKIKTKADVDTSFTAYDLKNDMSIAFTYKDNKDKILESMRWNLFTDIGRVLNSHLSSEEKEPVKEARAMLDIAMNTYTNKNMEAQ